MTPPPLAIVQARIGSTRLPGKMLLDLGGKPLVRWATDAAVEAFGRENVVAAIPASEENDELARVLAEVCEVFRWGEGPKDERNVITRFYACANRLRWHPDSVIVRVTPDDPFKTVDGLRRVARGERLPVEVGGEAFTLGMLNRAWDMHPWVEGNPFAREREHITHAIFGPIKAPPPPPAPYPWTIDTAEDLEAARLYLASLPSREAMMYAGALA